MTTVRKRHLERIIDVGRCSFNLLNFGACYKFLKEGGNHEVPQ